MIRLPIGVRTGSATCTGGTSTWTSNGSINDSWVHVTIRRGSAIPVQSKETINNVKIVLFRDTR